MWILSRWGASGSGLCNIRQDSKITYSLGEGNLAALIAGGSGGSIEAPGRAQTGTTCRLAFLMGVACQKCFCVTFDESNKEGAKPRYFPDY